jgi:hypothetical protein
LYLAVKKECLEIADALMQAGINTYVHNRREDDPLALALGEAMIERV